MATINIEMIDKINEQLKGITSYLDEYCLAIQSEIDDAGEQAQEILNEKMDELGENLTEKLEPIREKIIDIFRKQYQKAMEKLSPIEPLLNISLSIDTVVSVVENIIKIITAPYQPLIEFISQVIPKVLELSDNLQKVANYQPQIPLPPNITMPPLNVDIEPITPSDITG